MSWWWRDLPGQIRDYFAAGLWQVGLTGLPPWRRFLLRQLQLWVLVVREFVADRCLIHAASLAFTTLLSLVPLLALMFAVLKGFGVQNRLQPLILEYLAGGSAAVAEAIVEYINNTSAGHLGSVGLVLLVITVLALLSEVEKTFNAVWGVTETRPLPRRIINYVSVVTIGPVLVVAAISMTSSLDSQRLVQWLLDMALVGNFLIVLFNVLPFVVMWLVFAGLYLFVPNTSVSPRAAMIGGIFGGTLWQLSQTLYVDLQVGVSRYNTIYGALAALPVFMIWLFLAWAIVLLGLQVTFAVQNLPSVCRDLRGGRVSIAGRTRVVLAVLLHLARRFQNGEAPPCREILADELEIPPRLLIGILEMLQHLGLVTRIIVDNGREAYMPARDPATMVLHDVLRSIADDGSEYTPPPQSLEARVIVNLVEQLAAAGSAQLAGMTLRDLVGQAAAGEGKAVQGAGG